MSEQEQPLKEQIDFAKYPESLPPKMKNDKRPYVDVKIKRKHILSNTDSEERWEIARLHVDTVWGNKDSLEGYVTKGCEILGYGNISLEKDSPMLEQHLELVGFLNRELVKRGQTLQLKAEKTVLEDQVAAERAKNAELEAEIARLKGGKGGGK